MSSFWDYHHSSMKKAPLDVTSDRLQVLKLSGSCMWPINLHATKLQAVSFDLTYPTWKEVTEKKILEQLRTSYLETIHFEAIPEMTTGDLEAFFQFLHTIPLKHLTIKTSVYIASSNFYKTMTMYRAKLLNCSFPSLETLDIPIKTVDTLEYFEKILKNFPQLRTLHLMYPYKYYDTQGKPEGKELLKVFELLCSYKNINKVIVHLGLDPWDMLTTQATAKWLYLASGQFCRRPNAEFFIEASKSTQNLIFRDAIEDDIPIATNTFLPVRRGPVGVNTRVENIEKILNDIKAFLTE